MKNRILFIGIYILATMCIKAQATEYQDTVVNGTKYIKILPYKPIDFKNDTAVYLMVRNVHTDDQWRKVTIYYELLDSHFQVVYKLNTDNPVLDNWDSIKNNDYYPYEWVRDSVFNNRITLIEK